MIYCDWIKKESLKPPSVDSNSVKDFPKQIIEGYYEEYAKQG